MNPTTHVRQSRALRDALFLIVGIFVGWLLLGIAPAGFAPTLAMATPLAQGLGISGIGVEIGEQKADVLSRFTGDYSVERLGSGDNPETWQIHRKDLPVSIGMVQFTRGRASMISRDWYRAPLDEHGRQLVEAWLSTVEAAAESRQSAVVTLISNSQNPVKQLQMTFGKHSAVLNLLGPTPTDPQTKQYGIWIADNLTK